MSSVPNLSLVPPAQSEGVRGIDVAALQHAEIKAIDWTRVHLEADRNPPINVGINLGRWTMPVSRKGRA